MIPERWQSIQLKDVVQKGRKICYGIVQPGKYEADGIPLIRGKDYSFGWVELEDFFRVSEAIDRPYKRSKVKPRDLILTIVGAGTGNVATVPDWLDGANITQTTARIAVDHERFDFRYVRALLESRFGQHAVYRAIKGGAQPGLNIADVEKFTFFYPPKTVQSQIADAAEAWDRAIETVEALIANARAQKQALMQQLLPQGTTPPKKRLPGFSAEWRERTIKQFGKVESGGTPASGNPEYWGGDVAWVTPSEITKLRSRHLEGTERTITKKGLAESSAKLLPVGTVIVCTRATVGDLAIATTPMTTNQGFKNIVPNDKHDSEFLYYLLAYNKKALIRAAAGSTFAEVSKADFEKLLFVVPERAEQRAIASALINADETIERRSTQLTALRQEKAALMQQLLTGKRRVKLPENPKAESEVA